MHPRTSIGRDFQDGILVRLMEGGRVATLYLRNRMTLRGRILKFDAYVLLLEPLDGSPPQLVYKSALVSVSGPRQLGPGGGGPRGPRGPGPGGGFDRPERDDPRSEGGYPRPDRGPGPEPGPDSGDFRARPRRPPQE